VIEKKRPALTESISSVDEEMSELDDLEMEDELEMVDKYLESHKVYL
jgi:hypothetical protein